MASATEAHTSHDGSGQAETTVKAMPAARSEPSATARSWAPPLYAGIVGDWFFIMFDNVSAGCDRFPFRWRATRWRAGRPQVRRVLWCRVAGDTLAREEAARLLRVCSRSDQWSGPSRHTEPTDSAR